jgi:hypothetical protein
MFRDNGCDFRRIHYTPTPYPDQNICATLQALLGNSIDNLQFGFWRDGTARARKQFCSRQHFQNWGHQPGLRNTLIRDDKNSLPTILSADLDKLRYPPAPK